MKTLPFNSTTMLMVVAVLVLLSFSQVKPGKASPNTPVPVTVSEGIWFVTPTPLSASGDIFIMFNAINVSPIAHEFIVIRLKNGQTYDNLPISTDPASEFNGRVDEDALGNQILGAIEEENLPPGGSASITLGLAPTPDDYALICNLPGHYVAGMRSPFRNNGPRHNKDKDIVYHGKGDKGR